MKNETVQSKAHSKGPTLVLKTQSLIGRKVEDRYRYLDQGGSKCGCSHRQCSNGARDTKSAAAGSWGVVIVIVIVVIARVGCA